MRAIISWIKRFNQGLFILARFRKGLGCLISQTKVAEAPVHLGRIRGRDVAEATALILQAKVAEALVHFGRIWQNSLDLCE